MKCYFCNNEMKYKSSNNSADFYRYLEGRPIESNSYTICSNCGAVHDCSGWHQPKETEYLATQKQIDTIIKLLVKNKIVDVKDTAYKLVYKQTGFDLDYHEKYIKLSRKNADFIIKKLTEVGKNWHKKIEEFINTNITDGYLRSKFTINISILFDMLKNEVNF